MRLVYLSLGWASGIWVARVYDPLSSDTWLMLAGFAALMSLVNWHFNAASRHLRWLNLSVLALTLGGAYMGSQPTTSQLAQYNNLGGLTVTGIITAEPDVRDTRTLLRLRAEQVERLGQVEPTSGDVLVQVFGRTPATYGDRVRASGILIQPGEYDTFSYAEYLAAQGVFSIMEGAIVQVIDSGHGSPFTAALLDARQRAKDWINTHLPEPAAGLLVGILIGDERGISPELSADFQAAGAAHVIAISGFNMVIIAGVVIQLLNRALPERPWAALSLGLAVIVLYTLFTGGSAAVWRATLMTALLFIGKALERETFVPASLAFVVVVLTLLEGPTVLWDTGFQLSFMAVLGLALFADPLQRTMDRLLTVLLPAGLARGLGSFLQEPLVVSLAAQITVLPLVVLTFGRLSVAVFAVNLLIVPVQAYLLFAGALALLTFWLAPLSTVLFGVALVPLSWTIGVVRGFAALPGADLAVWVHPRWITGFYILLIGWAMIEAESPDRWQAFKRGLRSRPVLSALNGLGIVVLVWIAALLLGRPQADRLDVWFLDVEHSNGVLIRTPGGTTILVDGGRYPSRLLTHLGDRLPFTDQQLDLVIVTEPDVLNMSAVPAVLRRYDVGALLTNGQPNDSASVIELYEAAGNVPVVVVRAGHRVAMADGTLIEVLHPQERPDFQERLDDVPLVLRISYGQVSFLLPGDLSEAGQVALLDAGYWPQATVMQLPDHGSNRAVWPPFFDAVAPQAVVIGVDPANRFGEPTLAALRALPDVPIYRTDEDGTIHFWTDGERLWVSE